MGTFYDTAYSIFGKYYRRKRGGYPSLERDLLGSRMYTSVDGWLSVTALATVLLPILYIMAAFLIKKLLSVQWSREMVRALPNYLAYVKSIPVLASYSLVSAKGLLGYTAYVKSIPVLASYSLVSAKGLLGYVTYVKDVIGMIHQYKIILLISMLTLAGVIALYLAYFGGKKVSRRAKSIALIPPFAVLALSSERVRIFLLTRDALIYVIAPLVIAAITYTTFYSLPKINAWERGRKITALAPYAVGYISAMAMVGVAPFEIFRALSKEETFKEVSIEAKQIVRDVELLGLDFITALRQISITSPSKNLRIFFEGTVTTAISGGEVGSYFIDEAKAFLVGLEIRWGEFIETLSVISEVYIIGMVATPAFIIVMILVMAMLGKVDPIVLVGIVYVMLPMGTAFFVLLIDSITPEVG